MENQRTQWAGHARKIGILAVVAIAAVAAGYYLIPRWLDRSGGNAAGTTDVREDVVTALGRVEPEGGLVTIGVPLADRLIEIKPEARNGTPVKKGTILAVLASNQERQLEEKLLDIQIADAKTRRAQIEASGKAEIEAEIARQAQAKLRADNDLNVQKAKIELLKLQRDNAERAWSRLEKTASFSVSEQDRERQLLAVRQAQAELKTAEAAAEQMEAARTANQKAADAALKALRAKLASSLAEISLDELEHRKKLAEYRRDQSAVKSPMDGKVLEVLAREGELVGHSQPLFRMGKTDNLEVVAEVYETDRNKIAVGNPVRVISRTFPDRNDCVEGVVERIGSSIAKGRVVSADPTSEVDRRVVEVVIRLGKDRQRLANLIGHQVTVKIYKKSAP